MSTRSHRSHLRNNVLAWKGSADMLVPHISAILLTLELPCFGSHKGVARVYARRPHIHPAVLSSPRALAYLVAGGGEHVVRARHLLEPDARRPALPLTGAGRYDYNLGHDEGGEYGGSGDDRGGRNVREERRRRIMSLIAALGHIHLLPSSSFSTVLQSAARARERSAQGLVQPKEPCPPLT